jgi:membrane fusion protein (multidrug efflux system)
MASDQSTAANVAHIHPRNEAPVQVPQAPTAPAAPRGEQAPPPKQDAPPAKKGGMRRLILLVILLAALGYGGKLGYEWFTVGRFIVSTDDAYVGANTSTIAAKISGYVVDIPVKDNQSVKAGDVLVRIDPGDYKLAVDAAKAKIASQTATIARVQRQVEAQTATISGAEAQVTAARAMLAGNVADEQRASLEYDRSQKMAETNVGSVQRLEQAAADKARTAATLASSRANVAVAESQLAAARGNLEVLKAQAVEAERLRDELQNALDRAERDLSFTEIRAPFDGIVGNRAVQVGQYATPGTRLLALVNQASTYIDANYKETQLGTIKVGQAVDVAIDALDGRSVRGVVASIAPASGAQFSLLPPDNATGNFTKVVQRVAVRITIAPEDVVAAGLRPGLSVVTAIHTRDESEPKPSILGALGLTSAKPQPTVK